MGARATLARDPLMKSNPRPRGQPGPVALEHDPLLQCKGRPPRPPGSGPWRHRRQAGPAVLSGLTRLCAYTTPVRALPTPYARAEEPERYWCEWANWSDLQGPEEEGRQLLHDQHQLTCLCPDPVTYKSVRSCSWALLLLRLLAWPLHASTDLEMEEEMEEETAV